MSWSSDMREINGDPDTRFFYKHRPDEEGDHGFYFKVREKERARGPFTNLTEAKNACVEYTQGKPGREKGGLMGVLHSQVSKLAGHVC